MNARLAELQRGAETQLTIYGDSIYPRNTHIHSNYKRNLVRENDLLRIDAELARRRRRENIAFSKVRISVEWNYASTSNLFAYFRTTSKLKLMLSSNVAKVYTVGTILRNCHVALYGSETSYYFNLEIPSNMLEMYMNNN
jgi:hypothetical protein